MKSELRAATKKTQAQGKWAVWITHLDLSSLWAAWTLSFSQDRWTGSMDAHPTLGQAHVDK